MFGFSGSEGESVVLGDNTGESQDLEVKLGYDAVRLTFVPSAGDSGSEGSDDAADSDGSLTDASASAGGTDDGGVDGSDDGVDSDGTGTDDGALPTTFGMEQDDGGCACASSRGAPSWTWLAWLVIPLRRRARRRAA